MNRTLSQNQRLHKLIGILSIDSDLKEELVYKASGGRETSSANLTFREMNDLCEELQIHVNKMQHQHADQDNKMRRKIFSVFHELGYELPGGKLDYRRINDWMIDRSYLHKFINQYTHEELPRLVTQVENMLIKSYR